MQKLSHNWWWSSELSICENITDYQTKYIKQRITIYGMWTAIAWTQGKRSTKLTDVHHFCSSSLNLITESILEVNDKLILLTAVIFNAIALLLKFFLLMPSVFCNYECQTQKTTVRYVLILNSHIISSLAVSTEKYISWYMTFFHYVMRSV